MKKCVFERNGACEVEDNHREPIENCDCENCQCHEPTKLERWDDGKKGNSWFWPLLKEGENGSQLWERLQPYDNKGYDIWTKVTSGNKGRVICMRYSDKKVMAGVFIPR